MTTAVETLNPGHLKLELTLKGLRLDESARGHSGTVLSSPDEGTPGVELVLPGR